jgi:hypothetical protein
MPRDGTAGTPEVGPTRSSRTIVDAPQVSAPATDRVQPVLRNYCLLLLEVWTISSSRKIAFAITGDRRLIRLEIRNIRRIRPAQSGNKSLRGHA